MSVSGQLQQAYVVAMRHQQAGELEQAIQLYRHILASQPDFAEAHAHLGDALKAQGALTEAVGSYRTALALNPEFVEAQVNLGNALSRLGILDEAVASYREALASRPDFFPAHYNLGNALKSQGALSEAAACYRASLMLRPGFAPAYYNLGNALQAQGDLDGARTAYTQALAAKSDFAEAHNNLGTVFFAQGNLTEAMACYRRTLSLRPDYPVAFNNLGNLLKAQGKNDEASTAYRKALALQPDYAEAHNNLGILLAAQGWHADATACYRAALAVRPDFAEAYNNLGNALMDSKQFDEAIACYRQAIVLKQDYVEAYNHLGVALCEVHRIAEGFEWFTRSAERRFREAAAPANPPPHKVRHDREQQTYLAPDSPDDPALIERFHIERGARLAGPAINPRNNVAEIEEQWQHKKPQIVVIDNLLTPEALEEMRRFCWGSTIWRDVFEDGYLGARPESGFAAPLLAQIAEELRQTYAGIFHDHPLLYSWAFKYDNALSGIQVHADFAAVNVNFWITPDDANRDPDSGGLVVWDVSAPPDWDFNKYNNSESAIRDFLARENAAAVTIPYRANRAVIFDSDLFHETDRMDFRDGYQNRRINVTLLYGRRAGTEK